MMFDNNIVVDRYYYTFKEALSLYTYFKIYVNGVNTAYDVPMGLSEVIASMIPNAEVTGILSFEDATTRTLFTNYIWPEFQNATIAYIDKERSYWEEETEPTLNDMRDWFTEHGPIWLRWLRESKERYEPLITSFETIKDSLLGRVESVTTAQVKSSDTPQIETDPFDLEYVSRADQSTTTLSSDVNTPIERFREVQEKLRNLYADWANEFSRFVLHSAD